MNINNKILNNLSKIYLKPKKRITLEMIVTDGDKKGAAEFLSSYILIINNTEALNYCRKWLKNVEMKEKGKLNIRFTHKGPRIDIR